MIICRQVSLRCYLYELDANYLGGIFDYILADITREMVNVTIDLTGIVDVRIFTIVAMVVACQLAHTVC